MENIINSLKENLKDRISSPFYGAFIISWLIWNWKIWYITFFIDSDLLLATQSILKIDYIKNIYESWIYASLYTVILPLFSSYLIIFWLPKMTHMFYEKYLEYENQNNITKLKKEKEFLKEKAAKLEEEKNVLQKEGEVKIIRKEAQFQEEIWDKEYQNFKESKHFQYFGQLKSSLYEHGGHTWIWVNNNKRNIIPTDLKAYLNANEIIEFGKDENHYEVVLLTEKGKYFMKKYTEEN